MISFCQHRLSTLIHASRDFERFVLNARDELGLVTFRQ